MESFHQYKIRFRKRIERKNYYDNLVRASNCLGTTAHLFRTRIPAGYDLENKKAVSRTDY